MYYDYTITELVHKLRYLLVYIKIFKHIYLDINIVEYS